MLSEITIKHCLKININLSFKIKININTMNYIFALIYVFIICLKFNCWCNPNNLNDIHFYCTVNFFKIMIIFRYFFQLKNYCSNY